MFLADIPTPPPGSIEGWLLSFAAVVAIANQGVGLFKRFSPQAITMEDQFTTRASFHKHAELNRAEHSKIESRVAVLERKLESDKDDIIASGEIRAEKIHSRINTLMEKVGQLQGTVAELSRRLP